MPSAKTKPSAKASRSRRIANKPTSQPTGLPEPEQPPDRPRPSKKAAVLALLTCPEGASLDEIVRTTGWLPHTSRAFLTGLRKKGLQLARTKDGSGTSRYRSVAAAEPAHGA
jgi:hypothetical protein